MSSDTGLIDEKTRVPLGIVIGLLVSIGGTVFSAGVSHARLLAIEREVDVYRAETKRKDNEMADQAMKTQRLEIILSSMNDQLKEISRKLERMEKR